MLHHSNDANLADSHRNCLRLAERILEKFCSGGKSAKPQLASPAMTPAEMDRVRAEGFEVGMRPGAQVSYAHQLKRKHAMAVRNGARNSAISRAAEECMAEARKHGGKPPFGTYKRIADKHGIRYSSLMDRLSLMRWADNERAKMERRNATAA